MLKLFLDKSSDVPLFEQLRDQLIVDLHMSKVKPGDKLPSLRMFARKHEINIKTALKIYQRLKDENYLTAKQGSGFYVAPLGKNDLSRLYHLRILRLIRKNLIEAAQLQIDPAQYAQFVRSYIQRPKLRDVKLLIIECNEEQISLFAREIRQALKVSTIPMLLETLQKPDKRMAELLNYVACFVTTVFHFTEVEALAKKYGKLVFQAKMNPRYHQQLIKAATNGRLGMILSNTSHFPAFRKRLKQLGVAKEVISRIVGVNSGNVEEVKKLISRVDSVYISPLCNRKIKKMIPPGTHLISVGYHLSRETFEALEAIILFQANLFNK